MLQIVITVILFILYNSYYLSFGNKFGRIFPLSEVSKKKGEEIESIVVGDTLLFPSPLRYQRQMNQFAALMYQFNNR